MQFLHRSSDRERSWYNKKLPELPLIAQRSPRLTTRKQKILAIFGNGGDIGNSNCPRFPHFLSVEGFSQAGGE
jgi:hypothetical protein